MIKLEPRHLLLGHIPGSNHVLTRAEMAILYTINQSPAGLPRCEICTAVWGRSDRKVGKKFGVHIFNIRKKLAPAHIKIIHDEGTHLYHLAMSVQNGSDGCDAKSAT